MIKSYTLKKDYLTADGVTVPKGTVFTERGGIGEQYSYVSDIRKYDDARVGEVKTRLHLNPGMVENNPEWFRDNAFYFINAIGAIEQAQYRDNSDFINELRSYGNYFRSKRKAEEAQKALKIFFSIQKLKKRQTVSRPNTGTCTKEARAEKAGAKTEHNCTNQYDNVLKDKKAEPQIKLNDSGEVLFFTIGVN